MPMKKVKLLDLPLIRRCGGIFQEFEEGQANELIKQNRAEEIGGTIKSSVEQAPKPEEPFEEGEFIFPNDLIAMEG